MLMKASLGGFLVFGKNLLQNFFAAARQILSTLPIAVRPVAKPIRVAEAKFPATVGKAICRRLADGPTHASGLEPFR